jgi:branched-chain amino acid transport system permease protein
MVILGGMGTIPGSILGATILTITPEVLRFVSDNRMMLLGLSLILMMIFKPSGVWGENRRKGNTYGALRR